MQSPIQIYLDAIQQELSTIDAGALADYIPELTKANPDWFGISLVTMDGVTYSAGDADQRFTIQSISKPFIYATALADIGLERVMKKVGVEPSGDAFNSISLNPQTGAPMNPMINAGAIASTSLVGGSDADAQWHRIEESMAAFMGRPITVDDAVYSSESATGHRNRAIAWMLKNFSIIDGEPMASLENYFRQCAILVDSRDLAMMAATLANGGVHPVTGKRALPREHVDRVLSVMATCGMYDYAGSWLFEVGMPAKSGVGGGIIAVLPGRFGIGIFSPRLDSRGNSVRGIEACKRLSRDLGMSIFQRTGDPGMALGRVYTAADAPSRRHPSPPLRARLAESAHRIKYLCLHGFIAVDGADYVIRRMQQLAPETDSFILDMHQVDGLSESAARLINVARNGFSGDGIAVVLSRIHNRPAIMGPLTRNLRAGDTGFLSFEDNDLAVEWCENRLDANAPDTATGDSLTAFPLLRGLTPDLLERLQKVLVRRRFSQGERILVAGQAGDGQVFLIHSGTVSVLVPLGDGAHQRIATLGPDMNFGEMVLLGQTTRSATVHADTDTECSILGAADIDAIGREIPQLRIQLLENLAKDMGNNLRRATNWIAALA